MASEDDAQQLTEFERERQARMRRNQEMLASLGVSAAAGVLAEEIRTEQVQQQEQKRKRFLPQTGNPRPRSQRSSAKTAAQRLQAIAADSDPGATPSGNLTDCSSGSGSSRRRTPPSQPGPDRGAASDAEQEYSPDEAASSSSSMRSGSQGQAEDEAAAQQEVAGPSGRCPSSRTRTRQRTELALQQQKRADVAPEGCPKQQKPSGGSHSRKRQQKQAGQPTAELQSAQHHMLGPAADEEDEDWQLQLALQMSLSADGMGAAAAASEPAATAATAAAAAGKTAGGVAAAAAADMPARAAGDVQKPRRKRQKKLSPLEKQMVQLTPDDVFDLFAMFEPGDRGIISRRNLVRQMQQLGVAVPDDDMMRDMLRMGWEDAGGHQAGESGSSGSKMGLEQFSALVRHLWPPELVKTA